MYTKSDYCGPKALWLKPPRVTFFEASCKLHDEGYEEGGNELRRLVCDLFFYTHMLNDINKLLSFRFDSNESRFNNIKKYVQIFCKKLFYISWATLYFILVRLWGWVIFKYK